MFDASGATARIIEDGGKIEREKAAEVHGTVGKLLGFLYPSSILVLLRVQRERERLSIT